MLFGVVLGGGGAGVEDDLHVEGYVAPGGLALALDRDKLSDQRGILTPAASIGDALLARFPGAGVTLTTERLG